LSHSFVSVTDLVFFLPSFEGEFSNFDFLFILLNFNWLRIYFIDDLRVFSEAFLFQKLSG
jgi:hypothetical protein